MFEYGTASTQARTAVLIASLATSALIGLAACGSAGGTGAGHPAAGGSHTAESAAMRASAGVALCTAAGRVDRAVLSLTGSRVRSFLPREITIGDAPRVRALAAALCALPAMPPGVQCPADFGGVSRLVFTAGARDFQPVRIQLSGCRAVAGIGPTRSWSRSPRFGQLLTRTVGGKGRMIPGMHPSSVPTP